MWAPGLVSVADSRPRDVVESSSPASRESGRRSPDETDRGHGIWLGVPCRRRGVVEAVSSIDGGKVPRVELCRGRLRPDEAKTAVRLYEEAWWWAGGERFLAQDS